MSNISLPQPVRRQAALLLVIPVMALLVVGGWFGWRTWHTGSANNIVSIPTNPEIETMWGVRITQIGVTADGGLVDFRYQVLDPDKAGAMSEDLSSVPVLTDERSGTLVNSAALMPTQARTASRPDLLLFVPQHQWRN